MRGLTHKRTHLERERRRRCVEEREALEQNHRKDMAALRSGLGSLRGQLHV